MEEEIFMWDGRAKRKARKVVCKCGEEWLIRKDRNHSGLCRKCRFEGSCNPMFGKKPYNAGIQKYGMSYTKYIRSFRKQEIINQLGNECYKCKEKNLPIACYNLHHVDPETKFFSVLSMLNHNSFEKMKDIIQQEIKKCVLMCLNCHARHEYGELTALDPL